jgi:hypothetical protein
MGSSIEAGPPVSPGSRPGSPGMTGGGCPRSMRPRFSPDFDWNPRCRPGCTPRVRPSAGPKTGSAWNGAVLVRDPVGREDEVPCLRCVTACRTAHGTTPFLWQRRALHSTLPPSHERCPLRVMIFLLPCRALRRSSPGFLPSRSGLRPSSPLARQGVAGARLAPCGQSAKMGAQTRRPPRRFAVEPGRSSSASVFRSLDPRLRGDFGPEGLNL